MGTQRRTGRALDVGRWLREERGNAAVEFAMIAPVFLAMVLGTLAFGLWFGLDHSVRQLASEAARASVAGVTEAERNALALQQIQASVPTYGLIKRENLQISSGSDSSDPNLFRVTLVYDASSAGFGLLQTVVPSSTGRIQASASIRRGGA